ncbi:hypothetical protein ACFE04_025644 [Oxalis oulophora]
MKNDETSIGRKPRFLCLHGFRTSGEILKNQVTTKWPPSLLQNIDLVFPDAPFPAFGKSDVRAIYNPPYYEWFQFNQDFTEYSNLDKCFTYIEDYMVRLGPFDGLLGFSQGAILSAALPGLQAQGKALTKVPKIKCLIIVGGAKFKSRDLAQAYSSSIEIPSLHFLGETDLLKADGLELLEHFVDPVIIHHQEGHSIPRLLDAKGLEATLIFLDKIKKHVDRKTPPIIHTTIIVGYRTGYPRPASKDAAIMPSETNATVSAVPLPGQANGNASASKNTMDTVKNVLGKWRKKATGATKKAEVLAGDMYQHLKTGPSFADAAVGRITQGTKVLAEGGYEKIFRQTFETIPEEKLLKTYACYLSTSAGPIMGALFLSTVKLGFCSDNQLSYKLGEQTQSTYYKVAVPLHQLKAVNPSTSKNSTAEKFIEVISVDNHEFWFMGFVYYNSAVKNLQGALLQAHSLICTNLNGESFKEHKLRALGEL